MFRVFFFSLAQQPNAGQGRLILEVSRSHTVTHHRRYDSSGQGIGPSQRPLSDKKTTLTKGTLTLLPTELFFCILLYSVGTSSVLFFVFTVLHFAFCPYCTTHIAQTSMPLSGLKPAIPANDYSQIFALERSATGIDVYSNLHC
jgi:ribosomal protein L44E